MADDPIVITFDKDRMTFGEMIEFEDIAGVPVTSIEAGSQPTARMLMAIAYLGMKRDNPSITLEAVKAMDLSMVDFADPTEADSAPLRKLEQPKGTTKRAKASAA